MGIECEIEKMQFLMRKIVDKNKKMMSFFACEN